MRVELPAQGYRVTSKMGTHVGIHAGPEVRKGDTLYTAEQVTAAVLADRNNWTPLYPRQSAPPAPAAPVSAAVREQLRKMTDAYAKAMKDAGVSYYPEALAIVREARAVLAAVEQPKPTAPKAPESEAMEALKQIRTYCEECFDSDNEVGSVADDWRSNMSHVHSIASSALTATQQAEPSAKYLVCTGVVHEGEETYTVHDMPVPLADNWKLYTAPRASKEATPSAAEPVMLNGLTEAQTSATASVAGLDSQTPASTGVVSQKPVEVDDNPWHREGGE
jgi:hypothetical protein